LSVGPGYAWRASVSPRHMAYLHGIGQALGCVTNRILRIESKQVSRPILIVTPAVDWRRVGLGAVGERSVTR